ncbi:MAG: hypothetical protein H0X42_02305 [Solirubrobacterales bacterium]|nr:hypothetical protein [Solirubrobacterales bacterium]
MSLRIGLLAGALVAAAAVLAVVLIGGSSGESSPEPAADTGGPCFTIWTAAHPAALKLKQSGLDCGEAETLKGEYESALTLRKAQGPQQVAEVSGWRCYRPPQGAATLTFATCRSGGHELQVVAKQSGKS